jgi:branched-chain amino acid aminotransferase
MRITTKWGERLSDRIWHNGTIIDRATAVVSADDSGLLHGAGVFETMRAQAGRVFRAEAHLQRIREAAQRLLAADVEPGLPTPQDMQTLLEQNKLTDARLRLTVTAGPLIGQKSPTAPRPTALLTAAPLAGYPERFYANGIAVAISPFRQNTTDPLGGLKSLCYLPRLLALRHARSVQCEEALWFTENNHLAEGSISNVFLVRDEVVYTPPLDTPVLPGIARAAVLELAARAGIIVETGERPTIDDLLDADEVFLTNTIMLVLPVVRVEKRDIRGGKPGEITQRLGTMFRDLIHEECTR